MQKIEGKGGDGGAWGGGKGRMGRGLGHDGT